MVSTKGCCFTCLIAVLPIRTLHTLKAAGGLPLNDSFPGPCQAVSAAVGERHLEDGEHKSEELPLWNQSYSFFDPCKGEELGVRTSEADSGPIAGRERSRGPASWCLWGERCLLTSEHANVHPALSLSLSHTHTHIYGTFRRLIVGGLHHDQNP